MRERSAGTARIPITPKIQTIVDMMDAGIEQFRSSLTTVPPLGRYEAPDECLMSIFLITRNIESVTTLARRNLALLPSAMVLGRTIFEQGIRVKWFLYPENPFEREARWLAALKKAIQHHRLVADQMEIAGADLARTSSDARATASQIERFADAVEGALPEGITPPKIPSFETMAQSVGEVDKYWVYRYASQYVHGTAVATGIHRRNLGASKEFGDYISPVGWTIPLLLSWYGFGVAGTSFLQATGGDVEVFLPGDFADVVVSKIRAL